MKNIKRVYMVPGCISCGTCESVCPEVFEVKSIAEVKLDADLKKHEEAIREAVEICPVSVIKYEEE